MRDHSSLLAATAIGKKEVNGGAPLLKLISLATATNHAPISLRKYLCT